MIAPHPFGHNITPADLIATFAVFHQWEDRYYQLIQLAKQLPTLPDALKQPESEFSGCENRVWLGHQRQEDGGLHFYGDSESRVVRGLLAVLLTAIEGKTPKQLLNSDPLALCKQLGLHQQLSTSRTNGLQALAQGVLAIAAHYQEQLQEQL